MLYLELFTERDALRGDVDFATRKPASWFRRVLREAGVVGCGLNCYLPSEQLPRLAELERSL
jgi:hypothetical protein